MADEEHENECVHLQARTKRHHTNEGSKLKSLRGVGFVWIGYQRKGSLHYFIFIAMKWLWSNKPVHINMKPWDQRALSPGTHFYVYTYLYVNTKDTFNVFLQVLASRTANIFYEQCWSMESWEQAYRMTDNTTTHHVVYE